MIKNLLLTTILFVSSFNLFSQIINTSNVNYKSFEQGKTYFIESENEEINTYIKAILKTYWTINEFEFISESEVDTKSSDNKFYVNFFTYEFSRQTTDNSPSALNMNYSVTKLILFKALSETKKKDNRKPIGTLATIELQEISQTELLYSIQNLQSQIKYVLNLNTKKEIKFKKLLSTISDLRHNDLMEKTLYLTEDQLSPRIKTIEDIKKYYDHPVEIKSKDEIETAILNQDQNVIYAKFIRLTTLHFLIIISAENSELIYGKVSTGFTQNKIGPRFFKDMN